MARAGKVLAQWRLSSCVVSGPHSTYRPGAGRSGQSFACQVVSLSAAGGGAARRLASAQHRLDRDPTSWLGRARGLVAHTRGPWRNGPRVPAESVAHRTSTSPTTA